MGVKIEGLDNLQKRLRGMPDRIKRNVGAALTEGANTIRNQAVDKAPRDEGQLAGGIVVDAAPAGKVGASVTVNAKYGVWMEFGTGLKRDVPARYAELYREAVSQAGKGTFAEFVKNMEGWLKRHGGNAADAKFVALRILRNGLAPRKFFFSSLENNERRILQDVETAFGKSI